METLKQREDAERDQYGTGRLEGRIGKEKFLQEEEVRRLEGLDRGEGGAPSRYRGNQIGKKLLGLGDEEAVEDDEIVTKLTQAREDEEEYSSKWIEKMEKMMAAYDKTKTINSSFARPSFGLNGFDCPDLFATQQTHGAGGSGGGEENNNDERAHDAPVVDQPRDDEQPGDIPIHEPIGDDIPDSISNDDGGAGLEDPSKMHTSV